MPIDILSTYPYLSKIIGSPQLNSKLKEIEPSYLCERYAIFGSQKKLPIGFWNTIAIAAFETDSTRLQTAVFRLNLIEKGLEQASRCGKEIKFRAALVKDDCNFQQVLAELHLLMRLGPLADNLDIELPGSNSKKNYDLHLNIAETEIHIDCKWRTATPLGEVCDEAILDVQGLLGATFDSICFVTLRQNRIYRDDQKLELACLIDEARRFIRGERGPSVPLDIENMEEYLDGNALTYGMYQIHLGEEVKGVTIAGHQVAYIPSQQILYLEHELIDHIEFYRLLSPGEPGSCNIVPNVESQAVFSRETREHWGNYDSVVKCDFENPEHMGMTNLLREVYLQLPDTPYNVVCIGIEDESYFGDVEFALRGEPVPDPNDPGSIGQSGGLFNDSTFNTISGVIAFTLQSPTTLAQGVPSQQARFWKNDNQGCGSPLADNLVEKLCEALSG